MTIEERFERIEHITAGIAEERRKDREEYRQLWRETQRHINDLTLNIGDLTLKLADTNDTVNRFVEESREADKRLGERISELDKLLSDRIDSLVSAIGEFIRHTSQSKKD